MFLDEFYAIVQPIRTKHDPSEKTVAMALSLLIVLLASLVCVCI